jgi:hypothetical protein
MPESINEIVWKQFGASLDMMENSLKVCPPEVWSEKSEFWYIAYHTLFYTDYYLSKDPNEFRPPDPYTLSEFDPEGIRPDRIFLKEELIQYLHFIREKCRSRLTTDDLNDTESRFIDSRKNFSFLEIMIYNIRHIHHHVGQLNIWLRQHSDLSSKWVAQTSIELR